VEYCPILVPDAFNQDLNPNKAIHIYFSQAIPLITYIDEEHCLYLKENKCGICENVCDLDAIDFTQKDEKVEVKVGAVIFSMGFEPFDPKVRAEYKYGEYPNVVTSMDFERMLSSTGPYEGEILRPSDRKHPKKIAWLQCVGSRQVLEGANSYCSSVCCTYTQKQVILTKDHYSDTECVVFHNDIRAYGKDFERYFKRAKALDNVRFIRSYVTIIGETPENNNVLIRYSTPDSGVKEEEFDLVVLSVGLNPPVDGKELAEKFGIEIVPHGFCKTDEFNLIKTSKKGIFVSGAFQGPLDIPESVFTASGAVSQCGEFLNYRRDKLTVEREYPEEKDVTSEEPRVGVFVCHCGANIGRVVDVPAVVEYSLTLPYVVYAQEQLFSCSTNSAKEITDVIKEKGLNRLIVAACSPRNLEPTFRDSLREAGINQYFVDMANVREHCSWVHSKEKESATEKTKDLVRMSLARTIHLEPIEDIELSVDKRALVLGGGVAGMTCALSIANQGHEVYLIEKEKELGGMARKIYYTLEGQDVQAYLKELINKVNSNPLLHVLTDATIVHATGYVGNFITTVESEGRTFEIKHGATVIATGSEEYKPTEYFYEENEKVITQTELEEKIVTKDETVESSETIVMIQCIGCRNEDRNYCSRICCSRAVKNALKLKESKPETDVYILFRDMRMYGFREDYYREAANKDVKFIRYDVDNKPEAEIAKEGGKEVIKVTVPEYIIGKKLEINADLLVLSTAVVPLEDNGEIAKTFKVALSPDGFFQEAHVKLRPVDFGADGVFLCGTAHYPKHIQESVNQAYGAAGRVLTLLSHDKVKASGSVCEVNEKKCMGCGACVEVCTYGAIELFEERRVKKARINPVLCKGDGLCTSKCPTKAIKLKHFTDEQILSEIDALIGEVV
jgi:heterodisulfide reductase subunit A